MQNQNNPDLGQIYEQIEALLDFAQARLLLQPRDRLVARHRFISVFGAKWATNTANKRSCTDKIFSTSRQYLRLDRADFGMGRNKRAPHKHQSSRLFFICAYGPDYAPGQCHRKTIL